MSDKLIDKLNSAFDSYDQKKEEKRVSVEKRKSEHQVYLDSFSKVCDEVIMPTMEELGEAIEKRGHKYKISIYQEGQDVDGRVTPAKIQFEIYPEGEQPNYTNKDFPHLSFVAGTYDNKTYTHRSTMMPGRGGMAGKRNDYELEEITTEVVKNEIVNLVMECFK